MYINREISWLKFNARVLQEASDSSVPLLERIKFLGIYSNNLDEFYKVRYASVSRAVQFEESYNNIIEDQTPQQLLEQIHEVVLSQQKSYDGLYDTLIDELQKEDIVVLNHENILEEHKAFVEKFYQEKLSSSLVILYSKGEKKFLGLKDGHLYLAVKILTQKGVYEYAMIEVPVNRFGRFVTLPSVGYKQYVMYLEDIIRFSLKEIFKIFEVDFIEGYCLKITRDAELTIDSGIQKSLVDKISQSLEERKKGNPVRMVYDRSLPKDILDYLLDSLKIDDYDSLIPGSKYQNKRDLIGFPSFGRRDLQYEKIKPIVPKGLQNCDSYLKAVTQKDYLLYSPYHDYSCFIKFLREAAIDPEVTKIGITIYRVASDSQVMSTLINAARNGKQVIVVLELTARFDEAHNLYWANELRQYNNIEVIFGVKGLKVHSKLVYVERAVKDDKAKRFAVVSTGNFHEKTANIYTDFTLLTSDERITKEVEDMFNFFKSNYLIKGHKHLMVSPLENRSRIEQYIEQEIENKKKGLPAQINFKVNSLSDKTMIDLLYKASRQGVEVRIFVRGICCLVSGDEIFSKNISSISVIDKFLEHPRLYWFKNAGNDLVFISSADLMSRNLDHRIEIACPIYDEELKEEIIDTFELGFRDNVKGRYVTGDSSEEPYQKNANVPNRSQFTIYEYFKAKE